MAFINQNSGLIDNGRLLLNMSDEENRALWFEGPKRVTIKKEKQEDLGSLSSNEVLIRTINSGISAGTEMLLYRGQIPKNIDVGIPASLPSLKNELPSFDYPVKYGYSNVGKIVMIGKDVMHRSIGEVVFTFHPHETIFVARENDCIILPRSVEPLAAVLTSNIETAIGIVHDAHLYLGESVTVIGLGVVGILVALLAQRMGASVLGIEKIEKRRAIASSLGLEVTGKSSDAKDPDVIIEISGNPASLQEAINLAGFETRIIEASWFGSKEVNLNLGERFHRNRNRIISSQVSHLNSELIPRWSKTRRMELALKYVEKLPIRSLITDIFPFENASLAYQKIDEHPESTLQVVLDYRNGRER